MWNAKCFELSPHRYLLFLAESMVYNEIITRYLSGVFLINSACQTRESHTSDCLVEGRRIGSLFPDASLPPLRRMHCCYLFRKEYIKLL